MLTSSPYCPPISISEKVLDEYVWAIDTTPCPPLEGSAAYWFVSDIAEILCSRGVRALIRSCYFDLNHHLYLEFKICLLHFSPYLSALLIFALGFVIFYL